MKNSIKTIFWDFDGVIIDSNEVREFGFYEVLKDFPKYSVDKLLIFHRQNGGLSRYVKFRYFFEKILNQEVSEKKINNLATQFSALMLNKLGSQTQLIHETVEFILKNHKNFNFHIVSGSDGFELNVLCERLKLSQYFITIKGSPTPKVELVKNILQQHDYNSRDCILIGDSINDYEAAFDNNLEFWGYNNEGLKNKFPNYIDNFKTFHEQI